MLKRTPLFAAHQRLGGKLIEFGGWEMPVLLDIIEHLAVRKAGGLFDISHMGEVLVNGAGALDFLNATLTNDVRKLAVGQGEYTLMCNERGGVIDDLYAYRIGEQEFVLIINASRIENDVAWLEKQHAASPLRAQVTLKNISDATGAVALQGPKVRSFIDQCLPGPFTAGAKVSKASELKKNEVAVTSHAGQTVYVGCTGYTGEDGFEIIAPAGLIEEIWTKLLAVGHAHCLQPAGLGARDTLRTEVCYPLYGHELDENTTPIEAGVDLRGARQGRVHRSQRAGGAKGKWHEEEMCGVQDDGEIRAAASALRDLDQRSERGEGRRRGQWNAKSFARSRDWSRLRSAGTREGGDDRDRDRDPREAFACRGRREADLQEAGVRLIDAGMASCGELSVDFEPWKHNVWPHQAARPTCLLALNILCEFLQAKWFQRSFCSC